jgi:hypothetical protein
VFDTLDFVYLPSRDVEGDLEQFTASLRGRCIFAIEAFATRVALRSRTAQVWS